MEIKTEEVFIVQCEDTPPTRILTRAEYVETFGESCSIPEREGSFVEFLWGKNRTWVSVQMLLWSYPVKDAQIEKLINMKEIPETYFPNKAE